ncbi:AraC family transcriptional regulator [Phyllobacterium sp. SB3]|jgi:AraC-like DNA-binding protein|uniref:AraC family transcriptional regulator n=1 Tax=Phyllobacterium sp. SB3 TaxID=3156073 RepID=UPI0032AFABC6
MEDLLEKMRDRVLRHTDGIRMRTAIPRVGIGVVSDGSAPTAGTCGQGVCLVLQGAKQMLVGEKMLRYEAGSCFASLVELPTTRYVFEGTRISPYVATSLTIDKDAFNALVADVPSSSTNRGTSAFSVALASRQLVEAWDNYLALLDTPEDIPALAASRERELMYRLLQSPHGSLLRQIGREEGKLSKVREAIEWIRQHFDQPLEIKDVAERSGMSIPSFNRHFRQATSTSPLQYQKMLRLHAARRLLAADTDAAHAAFEVGYESASQFSREYSRLFGRPPRQDASLLRKNIGSAADVMI